MRLQVSVFHSMGFISASFHTQAIDGAIKVQPEDAKDMVRCSARKKDSPSTISGRKVWILRW